MQAFAGEQALLARLTSALAKVPDVQAIVLGGSRARGITAVGSDYDIGLYYAPGDPLDIESLNAVVATLDDTGPAARATAIGAWGPWINGGGWLTVGGTRVDLLYRDLARVRSCMDACRTGHVERHYQPGHPHAFVTAIYMGEVAYGRPLWDPTGVVAALKQETHPYPKALGDALIELFLPEAYFALDTARHGRALDDPIYVLGCCFRSLACLCQVVFAINRTYLLNEKGAIEAAQGLARRPADLHARISAALRDVMAGRVGAGLERLEALVKETEALIA